MPHSQFAKRILVVEDDALLRQMIMNVLRKDGHEVYEASGGIEGVGVAQIIVPDLILMDIGMPEIDGYQATLKIKQQASLKDVPVLFVSGKSPAEDGGKSFAVGGAMYLRKPFSVSQLRNVVNVALGLITAPDAGT